MTDYLENVILDDTNMFDIVIEALKELDEEYNTKSNQTKNPLKDCIKNYDDLLEAHINLIGSKNTNKNRDAIIESMNIITRVGQKITNEYVDGDVYVRKSWANLFKKAMNRGLVVDYNSVYDKNAFNCKLEVL
jgi:hypothetical protein